jgi:hypothetical protein
MCVYNSKIELFSGIKLVMGVRSRSLNSDVIVEDLTAHEVGDIDLWIGKHKEYHSSQGSPETLS